MSINDENNEKDKIKASHVVTAGTILLNALFSNGVAFADSNYNNSNAHGLNEIATHKEQRITKEMLSETAELKYEGDTFNVNNDGVIVPKRNTNFSTIKITDVQAEHMEEPQKDIQEEFTKSQEEKETYQKWLNDNQEKAEVKHMEEKQRDIQMEEKQRDIQMEEKQRDIRMEEKQRDVRMEEKQRDIQEEFNMPFASTFNENTPVNINNEAFNRFKEIYDVLVNELEYNKEYADKEKAEDTRNGLTAFQVVKKDIERTKKDKKGVCTTFTFRLEDELNKLGIENYPIVICSPKLIHWANLYILNGNFYVCDITKDIVYSNMLREMGKLEDKNLTNDVCIPLAQYVEDNANATIIVPIIEDNGLRMDQIPTLPLNVFISQRNAIEQPYEPASDAPAPHH